ncbi:MAG: hypothetical protein VXZ84_06825 [Planctomycetota bacterium]|nr:hypothetical protein [Planctomycetota bacterium]
MGDVVTDKFEIGLLQQVDNIAFLAGEKIVQADDIVPFGHHPFAQESAQKSGTSGDQNAFLRGHGLSLERFSLKLRFEVVLNDIHRPRRTVQQTGDGHRIVELEGN